MVDGEALKVGLEGIVLVVSGLGSLMTVLVKRAVAVQDEKLASIDSRLEDLGDRVGSHAERLAEAKAQIEELRRRSGDVEKEVREIATRGCARACVPTGR